ncbi:SDR family oxidoreductase [Algoriphagus namhaensis]
MIGITEANGQLGLATIQFLLNSKTTPQSIVAKVRDPEKIKALAKQGVMVRKADYNDYDSLVSAFKGVKKLLQISTTSIGEEGIRQERNVVKAAIENRIDHIIYTSSIQPKENAYFLATLQSIETENAIKNSGINYTLFRNSLYMESIPGLIGNALNDGIINYPAQQGKVSFVSRTDIAEALSIVLTTDGHLNKAYEITGSKVYDFSEIATILGQIKGRAFQYNSVSIDAYKNELRSFQLPEPVIELLVSMAMGIRSGEFSYIDDTLRTLLKRPPRTLTDYLESL